MNKENFTIDFQETYFIPDYKTFYKKQHKNKIQKNLILLFISLIVFYIVKTFFDLDLIESICFGAIIFSTFSLLFQLYYLFTLEKKLNKVKTEFTFGKMNLIIEPTFIEFNRYGGKRVIFISQLKKCIATDEVLFFIETNNKIMPLKINKREMTKNSFNRLINVLKRMNIKMETL